MLLDEVVTEINEKNRKIKECLQCICGPFTRYSAFTPTDVYLRESAVKWRKMRDGLNPFEIAQEMVWSYNYKYRYNLL